MASWKFNYVVLGLRRCLQTDTDSTSRNMPGNSVFVESYLFMFAKTEIRKGGGEMQRAAQSDQQWKICCGEVLRHADGPVQLTSREL